MNKSLSSLLYILCLCLWTTGCLAQAAEPARWQQFSSTEGRFQADFPGAPESSVRDLKSPLGTIKNHEFATEADGIYYAATYTDHAASTAWMTEAQRRALLDATRDAICGKPPTITLLGERDIQFEGVLGRELTLSMSGATARYRLVFSGSRFYQLAVAYDAPLENDPATPGNVARFMDSFKTLK